MKKPTGMTYRVRFVEAHVCHSWEPEENLEACSRLLQSFWNHIGTDNDDYQIGHEVKAKKDWIGWVLSSHHPNFQCSKRPLEKEKAFFAKEYQTAQEELKRQEKEGNRNPKKARELT